MSLVFIVCGRHCRTPLGLSSYAYVCPLGGADNTLPIYAETRRVRCHVTVALRVT